MENRDIEITITSAGLPEKVRPVVCFRWKLRDGKGVYVESTPVRIQPSSTPQPRTLKLSATVPYPEGQSPSRDNGFFTSDNAAPVADVRLIVLGESGNLVDDVMATIAIVAANDYCNVPFMGFRTDNGVATQNIYKNWQPPGGEVEFTVKTSKTIPNDGLIRGCFRWKLVVGDPGKFSEGPFIRVLDRQPNLVKVTATVPALENRPPRKWEGKAEDVRVGSYGFLDLFVPQVDGRLLVFDTDLNPVVDTWTKLGLTEPMYAGAAAIATIAIAFWCLWVVSRRRFPTLKATNPLLFLITTRRGFASLSQFQIILWTFVVVASAAYVIALSGDLIPITAGTLTLLGISGAATVIAKAKSENDAAAPTKLDPAAAAAEARAAEDKVRKEKQAAITTPEDDDAEGASAVDEAVAKAEAARAKSEAADAVAAAARAREAVVEAADREQAQREAQAAEKFAEEKRKAAAIAAARAAAVTRIRHPRWSDLVMEEIEGRELDVTRVQMLFFTLVTAVFVVIKVAISYEIPIIPEGFLILMGISNSVYVGSKFATNPAAKT
jgi:hypothetical protein